MIDLGTNFWANSFFVLPKNEIIVESEFATFLKHYSFGM
jgi:hypothetical protein